MKRKSRNLLMLIAALIFLPILLAFAFLDVDVKSWGRTSHGQFVMPTISLEALGLKQEGGILDAAGLHGRWAFLFVVPPDCSIFCFNQIKEMQNIQIALGRYQDRLLKFLVLSPISSKAFLKEIAIDQAAILRLETPSQLESNRLYLVDPFGNIVMVYQEGEDGMNILKDIRHLIKTTHTVYTR